MAQRPTQPWAAWVGEQVFKGTGGETMFSTLDASHHKYPVVDTEESGVL